MKITKMTRSPWGFEFDGFGGLSREKMLANDVVFYWESHPHKMRPWLIYNEFGAIGLVWASHAQDAMDEAADNDLLDGHLLEEKDVEKDYLNKDGEEDERVVRLGNASEPFDGTYLGLKEVSTKDFPPELLVAFAEARGAGEDSIANFG